MKKIAKKNLLQRKSNFYSKAIVLAILSFISVCSQAQEPEEDQRHEFYFGLGLGNSFLDYYSDRQTEPEVYKENIDGDCWGIPTNFNFEYRYKLTKRISVGGSIGYTTGSHSNYIEANSMYKVIGSSDLSAYYVMPCASFTWFKSDNGIFRAYSGAGLGLALLREKADLPRYAYTKVEAKLAYNVTMAGLSVGGQHFKFFAEMNGGCKGMLLAGLLVRL